MGDDFVPVAGPSTAVPSAPYNIKTFSMRDASGTIVDVQAVVLVDEYGRTVDPITEDTGQAIVSLLTKILATVSNGDTE